MDVRVIKAGVVAELSVDELPDQLDRKDGLVWVDIPTWDEEAARVLAEVFAFHPLAIRDSLTRSSRP